MRLLFDCHTFDVGPQGTTTFLAGLLNALPKAAREAGLSVELVCAAKNEKSVSRFVEVPYAFETMTGGFIKRNMVTLPQLIRTCDVDAAVSQYVRPFRSAAPTVAVVHDVLFLDFPELFSWRYRKSRQLLFGWSARHSDVVATVSEYSRERISHHFGVPADRIDVLPNAVDGSDFPQARKGERSPTTPLRLLYVSRFETRKRQHWCVAVADALAARGQSVEMTFVGHAVGAYADTVRAMIAEHSKPGVTFRILSDISNRELDDLYANADLFLFPSECEGFGIPVIEAAARGVPCVVSANTAMRELSGHYSGIGVEGSEVETFVAGVMRATEQLDVLAREAAVRAPETRSRYRWSDVADGFLSILRRRGIAA